MASVPPGGVDLPTPMVGDGPTPAENEPDSDQDEEDDEEEDHRRRMDLCAWQAGRAIQQGRPTYESLLDDADRAVVAAAAEMLLLWPETRGRAKQALVRAIDSETDQLEQARRILELGVYGSSEAGEGGDLPHFARWAANDRPLEVRAAAGLAWAWTITPAPLPPAAASALEDASAPESAALARLPWEGVYIRGPWSLPENAAAVILRLAASHDHELRWRAVQGLRADRVTAQHLSAPQVIPTLVRALADPYNRIRDAAAFALSQRAESILEVDPQAPTALLAALEPHIDGVPWGDRHGGLDTGASALGHAGRLLATLSHRLNDTQRQQAFAAVERAIRHCHGTNQTVLFDTMGIPADRVLREQLEWLRAGRPWEAADWFEAIGFPTKKDRRQSLAECDRQLGRLWAAAPEATLAVAIAALAATKKRDAMIGAALWLTTLGPAAAPALPQFDALADADLDGYARMQVDAAAKFIRASLKVKPDATHPPSAEDGTNADHVRLAEGRLAHADASVRAAAADVLAMHPRQAPDSAIAALERLLVDKAGSDVGVTETFEFQGRLYHWRRERRAPRASAVRALLALGAVTPAVLAAMLTEAVLPAREMGLVTEPQRFTMDQWRQAAVTGDAEARLRQVRQTCREKAWRGGAVAVAADGELRDVLRSLSGRRTP